MIRLRAWNISGERWVYFTLKEIADGGVITSRGWSRWRLYKSWGRYIGAKDKNGKTIYEGDIWSATYSWGAIGGIVEFHKGCFCLKMYDDSSWFCSGTLDWSTGTVKGDRHTTPELWYETTHPRKEKPHDF